MNNEYKPGFKGWLFSMFLAAGFGSLGAEGVKYLVLEWSKKDTQLELRDMQCQKNNIYVCNYYFENVGDKTAYITKAVIAGNEHSTFFTNAPIEVFSADIDNPVKRAHVAISEPGKMLMVGLSIKEGQEKGKTCFFNGDTELLCI